MSGQGHERHDVNVVNDISGPVAGQLVQAGDIHGDVTVYGPLRSPVRLPYRVGVVPPRAEYFQSRDVSGVLGADRPVHTIVLSGMAGVGKTQLAAAHVEHRWAGKEVDLLAWIPAESREAVILSYASLAADLTGIEDNDPVQGAKRLLAWLASTGRRWTVALDDVRSPADLTGLWPPFSTSGQVIATTCRRDAALRGDHRRVVEVGLFSPTESRAYLVAKLADRPHLAIGAVDLVPELGHLPLALAQAAAYVLDEDMTCIAYRSRLLDRRRRLESLLPDRDALPDEHRDTVAATWSLSIERANQLAPRGVAGPLLALVSVLDANGVPINVFATDVVLSYLTSAAGHDVTFEIAQKALTCLHRLSLVDRDWGSPHRAVRVHAIVQRATRDRLSDEQIASITRIAADALMQVWPHSPYDNDCADVFRANTDALARNTGSHLWMPDPHEVLFRAGHSLGECGMVAQAVSYFRQLHALASQRRGAGHPDALLARNHAARWVGLGSDIRTAAAELEELLADARRELGPDHANTIAIRHSLIFCRRDIIGAAASVATFTGLLNDARRALGSDHTTTLRIRLDLAHSRGEAGDRAAAVAALTGLLADQVRVLGTQHSDTVATKERLILWKAVVAVEGLPSVRNGSSGRPLNTLHREIID